MVSLVIFLVIIVRVWKVGESESAIPCANGGSVVLVEVSCVVQRLNLFADFSGLFNGYSMLFREIIVVYFILFYY